MAKGDKPRFTITARRKDAPNGSQDRIKLGAAFEADRFPGNHRASFREVVAMKLEDGTVLKTEDYYFDLKDWSAPREGKKGGDSAEPAGGLWGGGGSTSTTSKEPATDEWGTKASGHTPDDDIPFRAPPRTAKDIA